MAYDMKLPAIPSPVLRGPALAEFVTDWIEINPERWTQADIQVRKDCGSAFCFCGWVAFFGGGWNSLHGGGTRVCFVDDVIELTAEFLGVSYDQADWAFNPSNTLEELEMFAAAVGDPEALKELTGHR